MNLFVDSSRRPLRAFAHAAVALLSLVSALAVLPVAGSINAAGRDPMNAPAPASVRRIDTGLDHGCAVTPDGKVQCWGDNTSGALGVIGVTQSATPVIADLPAGWYATGVAVGEHHTCALLADGGVGCWGYDIFGALGAGPGDQGPGPVRAALPSGRTAVGLDANIVSTCAILDDGTLWCWGWNGRGELGQSATGVIDTPQWVVMPNGEAVIDVATYPESHGCAVLDTGAVTCWGDNARGQFGDGTTTPSPTTGSASTPMLLATGVRATSITVSDGFSCAVGENGLVYCWGVNTHGQLGDGTTTPHLTPNALSPTPTRRAVDVAAGYSHACAHLDDGSIACWGTNSFGQFGNGTTSPSTSPVTIPNVQVLEMSAGNLTTCAVLVDGTVSCWGSNNEGQVGDGTTIDRSTPVTPRSFPTGTRLTQVAAGSAHTCVLSTEGLVWCWGNNYYGQLGRGTISTYEADLGEPVALPAPGRARAITAGFSHTCALLVDGQVSCWGLNNYGQVGVSQPGSHPTPSQPLTMLGSRRAKAISAGGAHSCVLYTDGTMACWGRNDDGQLGDGFNTNRRYLDSVILPGGMGAVSVDAGAYHTCAVLADGAAACWGYNGSGALGDTTTTNRNIPTLVNVPAGERVREVAAGNLHTCVRYDDGTVSCWGGNSVGQSGVDPANGPLLSPTGTLSLPGGHSTEAIALAIGGGFSCVLLDDGGASCWGVNDVGSLGDGTTSSRFTPALVAAQPDAVPIRSLSSGEAHACAVRADGTLSCWGGNYFGQLGLGDRTDRTTPTLSALPTAPVSLTAAPATTSATLSWVETTSPYQPQTWQVEGSTDGTSWWPATVSAVSPSATEVSGLTSGVPYTFRVRSTTPLSTHTVALSGYVTPKVQSTQLPPPPVPSTPAWVSAAMVHFGGDDPAEVAAAMSRHRFAAGAAPMVHVAVATRPIDAAAAGAAAVHAGGPVLLVQPGSLSVATATEIARLGSRDVVVVGGRDAIGDDVVGALRALDGVNVTRLHGSDRYATAASVSRATYEPGVDTVYVVSGLSTIDGLGTARFGGPLLLTGRDSLPGATVDELARLAPQRVVVIGGASVVSDAVLTRLEALVGGEVVRWAGADRFATAAMVADAGRSSLTTAVLVDGRTPAGGMAAATLLGDPDAALVLTNAQCVPAVSRALLDRWSPGRIITAGVDPDLGTVC